MRGTYFAKMVPTHKNSLSIVDEKIFLDNCFLPTPHFQKAFSKFE